MRTLVLITSILSALTACQTVEVSTCVQQDWFEIGRRSGVMGQPHHDLDSEFARCGEKSKAQSISLYSNGRNAGLTQYCQPGNAFEMGKLNQPYLAVCPQGLELEFLEAYSKGKRLYKLKVENEKLENELQTLKKSSEDMPEDSLTILRDLDRAKKQIQLNEKQIRKLSSLEDSNLL